MFNQGHLVPNLELGHHPFREGKTYEEWLGKAGMKKLGREEWNRLLGLAIDQLRALFSFRRLYLGGGNAKKVDLELAEDVVKVQNVAGLSLVHYIWPLMWGLIQLSANSSSREPVRFRSDRSSNPPMCFSPIKICGTVRR